MGALSSSSFDSSLPNLCHFNFRPPILRLISLPLLCLFIEIFIQSLVHKFSVPLFINVRELDSLILRPIVFNKQILILLLLPCIFTNYLWTSFGLFFFDLNVILYFGRLFITGLRTHLLFWLSLKHLCWLLLFNFFLLLLSFSFIFLLLFPLFSSFHFFPFFILFLFLFLLLSLFFLIIFLWFSRFLHFPLFQAF